MKQTITRYELALLDGMAITADRLEETRRSLRQTQLTLTESVCRLLLVDEWDANVRAAVRSYIEGGARMGLEDFLARLGVAVHDPLTDT